MYSKSRLAYKWFVYIVRASSSRGHGIHSPFVYEFIHEVLNDRRSFYAYEKIEQIKEKLLKDKRAVYMLDRGAGFGKQVGSTRKVSEIATKSLSTKKFGRLLLRLANFYRPGAILEMGTSLGISTAYLASANSSARVTTMEGSLEIADIALQTFRCLDLKNVDLVTGSFEDNLDLVVGKDSPYGLIFMDGNHRKEPVLAYFEKFLRKHPPNCLIVIHDIHWSQEMEEAWKVIQGHPDVKMTIDIFSAGLIFFREEFQVKQQFTVRF